MNSLRFSLLPVEKLSRQTTEFPEFKRDSTRFEPIKPAPPVTNTLLSFKIRSISNLKKQYYKF
jgi:hypothetical protein